MRAPSFLLFVFFVLLGAAKAGTPQASESASIYTCIDAQGRRLTADRPIMECIDREQRELNSSGVVKRIVKPVPTAAELQQAERDAQQKATEEARAANEQRQERILLARSPNPAVHERRRADVLEKVNQVIASARERTQALVLEQQALDQEIKTKKSGGQPVPMLLLHRQEEAQHSLEVQRRFLADQMAEKDRINSRFDAELVTLKRLWLQSAEGGSSSSSAKPESARASPK